MRIMGIEEGKEVQAKGIHNIFKKIIQKISQIYGKLCPFRYRKAPRHQTDLTKIKLPHDIVSIKKKCTENKERILKTVREKKQITHKGKPIKITTDFSTEILKARRAWSEVFWALNEFNSNLGYSTQQNYHSK
jgi:hypothetical protein